MRSIAIGIMLLAPLGPFEAAAQVRRPCVPGETVDRRCPDSPLYNRRGVDIQPGRPTTSPFQSPYQSPFGSQNSQAEQQRRIQQRNQGN